MRDIGRVVVEYAHLEWLLGCIAGAALNISAAEWRLTAGRRSAPDIFDLARSVLELKEISVTADYKALSDAIKACHSQRNSLAHGTWSRIGEQDDLVLVLASGSWSPRPRQPQVKRAIKPEGTEYGRDTVKSLLDLVRGTTATVLEWNEEIVAAQSSGSTDS